MATPGSPSGPPNPQRRSEKSRLAILTAALELCAEKGYGGVTIEAIAAHAGVSKKTIYRWWPSKGAVVLESVTDGVEGGTPFIDTGDLAADLRTHMTGLAVRFATAPYGPAYAGILSEVLHDDALARTLNEQLISQRFAAAKDRLRSAQLQGELPEDTDLELAAEMLYGPLYYRYVLRQSLHTPARIAELIDHVLRAFRP
ncbi:TetR/AcrR family transcriptional regulator [Streptomyces sp. H27-C3]|uniref:TetR/AcrR family transcriptional regulator n=1 Tax=Streptomyces sp. H27-C3 TaxID=3046305 RepID=UPI0024BB3D6E|nr:TetR/AcrR family transcriptional regulator [Streptomyces sp. H27-C3]MDJ0464360.1 TetR/AcrR family transcriptional regulator [Streptomyces sp. H27-C3]